MRTLTLTQVPTEGGGYLGVIVVDGDRVFAAGGTHHNPTLLVSEDRGHTFQRWKTPPEIPGLRDVHVEGDVVWVAGEWGRIARTIDRGATWTALRPAGKDNSACLYSIMRGVDRKLWVLGDHGLVLRSRSTKATATKFERVENVSTARLLYMFVDGIDTWLLDSAGELQRSSGKEFVDVPLKAMRNARPLCALVRTPRKTLLLLGDGGLVLRSTTDGATWKKISIDSRNDLEKLMVTRYGIFIVGAQGSLLVSHDDGQSFQGLATAVEAHLWSLAEIGGELVIGAQGGIIYRIDRKDLAEVLRRGYVKRDPLLAELAARLRDGDEGAELVLEDALKERELL